MRRDQRAVGAEKRVDATAMRSLDDLARKPPVHGGFVLAEDLALKEIVADLVEKPIVELEAELAGIVLARLGEYLPIT